jgi:hypothetical protein
MAYNGAQKQREAELQAIFQGIDDDVRTLIGPTVENVIYIEAEMERLAKLPKIQVHPKDPNRQRATPAAKLYKEFLQQHTNCIKLLSSVLGKNAGEEESPLRQWLEERRKQNAGP